MKSVTITSSDPKQAASSIFRCDQGAARRRRQLSTSGVMMMIPTRSPCHQVHQFERNCGHDTRPAAVIDNTAIVAAIVQLSAATATNTTTSLARSKRRGTPMKCRMRAAPASASKALPVPIAIARARDELTV